MWLIVKKSLSLMTLYLFGLSVTDVAALKTPSMMCMFIIQFLLLILKLFCAQTFKISYLPYLDFLSLYIILFIPDNMPCPKSILTLILSCNSSFLMVSVWMPHLFYHFNLKLFMPSYLDMFLIGSRFNLSFCSFAFLSFLALSFLFLSLQYENTVF